jgi:hypothetical protein
MDIHIAAFRSRIGSSTQVNILAIFPSIQENNPTNQENQVQETYLTLENYLYV